MKILLLQHINKTVCKVCEIRNTVTQNKMRLTALFIFSLSLFTNHSFAQNVGINTTGATPVPSAILDIASSTAGLLIPRMQLVASNNPAPITAPALSLLVFNLLPAGISPNDVKTGYYYWEGSKWVGIGTGSAWALLGNAGTVAGTNFVGTTDAVDFVTKTNGVEKMRVTTAGNVGIGTPTPNTNALLDVVSTSKGMLMPRVTSVQRLAINNNTADATIAGLQVYDLTTSTFWYHDGTFWVQASNNPDPSLGAISIFPYTAIPTDYLECNGNPISRSTYAALFAKIGITYGVGNGSTTFNLPDLRGEFVRGWDNTRGVDASRVFGSNQADAFQGHYHDLSYPFTGSTGGSLNVALGTSVSSGIFSNQATSIISDGTNGAPRTNKETRPRNLAMIFAIKAIPTTVTYGSNTTDAQTLSFTGNTLTISNGNSVALPVTPAWSLIGNTGTVAGTNFVGTTDAVDFVTKTNGVEKMRVTTAGNIGVGTAIPNASAIVDITSTTQGFAMPRMTNVQRKAIAIPTAGLQVYDLTLKGYYTYDGAKWDCVTVPAGSIGYFANVTAPNGYLECNGQAVNRITYAELFVAIGTLYGAGNGSTTFNLPDLRGEFIRGADNARGLDAGRVLGTAQIDDFKSHTHLLGVTIQLYGAPSLGSGVYTQIGSSNTSPAGGVETRPRNVAMLPCIKF